MIDNYIDPELNSELPFLLKNDCENTKELFNITETKGIRNPFH